MSYKRTEKTSKATGITPGKHRAKIIDIGEKTIEVDEMAWSKEIGAKVSTGNRVPKTFMEWSFQILDDGGDNPEVTDLYNISWFSDNKTGVQSKLVRTTEKLGLLPEIGGEFEPSDAIGREVEVSVIIKDDWPRVDGPIMRALDAPKKT